MRKLIFNTGILFVCLSLLIFSCSEDNSTYQSTSAENSNKITQSEQTLAKKMFVDMMSTSDYSNYQNSLDAFVEKMNGNAVYFKTKAEYMSWISNNISSTLFTSTQQFSAMLDDMVAKHALLVSNNSQLFTYILNADTEQRLEIIKPSLVEMQVLTSSNSCTDQCISDYEDAWNGNEWAYSLDYGINSHAFAEQIYKIRVKSITDDLSNCVYFC